MATYAIWNNKGGVGKSYLTFQLACEYARVHPTERVLVVDFARKPTLPACFSAAWRPAKPCSRICRVKPRQERSPDRSRIESRVPTWTPTPA